MYTRVFSVLSEVTDRNVLGKEVWTDFFFRAFLAVLCIRSQQREFTTDDIEQITGLYHKAEEVATEQHDIEGRVMARLFLTQFVFDMFVCTDAAKRRLQLPSPHPLTHRDFLIAKGGSFFLSFPNPLIYNTSAYSLSNVCAACGKPINAKKALPLFCCACCGLRLHQNCIDSNILMKVSSHSTSVTVCAKCCGRDTASIQVMLLKNALGVSSILQTMAPSISLPMMFHSRVLQMMSSMLPESREQYRAIENASLTFFLRNSLNLTLRDPMPIGGTIAHVFYRKCDTILRREIVAMCSSLSCRLCSAPSKWLFCTVIVRIQRCCSKPWHDLR